MFKRITSIPVISAWLVILLFPVLLFAQSDITSLQFDSISEIQGMPQIKSSCFVKSGKMRIEIQMFTQSSVFLYDGMKAYLYFPMKKIAMSVPVSQVHGQMPVPKDYKDIPGLKNIGQEEVDGRLCEVYEYTSENGQHKIWVAKDIDYPVKAETITEKGKVTTYISNFRKNITLDDNLFRLPSDAQVLDTESFKNLGQYF